MGGDPDWYFRDYADFLVLPCPDGMWSKCPAVLRGHDGCRLLKHLRISFLFWNRGSFMQRVPIISPKFSQMTHAQSRLRSVRCHIYRQESAGLMT
jgi:hypothetical protein